jgi:hypothetical protein
MSNRVFPAKSNEAEPENAGNSVLPRPPFGVFRELRIVYNWRVNAPGRTLRQKIEIRGSYAWNSTAFW